MTQLTEQNSNNFEPDLSDIIRKGNNTSTNNPVLEKNNEPDLSEIISRGRSQDPQPTPAASAAQSVNAAGRYSQQQLAAARQHAATLGLPFDDVLQHADAAGQMAGQVAEQDLQGFHPRTLDALQGKARYAARQDLPALNMLAQALDEAEWPYAQPQFPQQAQQPQGPQLFATPTSGLERMGIRIQEGTRELGDALANQALGLVEGYAKHLRRGMEADQLAASPQGKGWLETIGRAITDSAQPVSQPDAQTAQGMRAALVPVLENFAQNYRSNIEAQQNTRNAPLAPAQNAVQRYTEDVVKMAPQMAAQALAYAGLGGVASTLFMGAQIGGQAYGEMRDKGVDADTALVSSLANAAMQAPLEQLGLEKALSVFKASGVWNAVKAIAGAAGTEFLTEWAQQYPDEIAHIWAETTQKGQGFEQGFKTFVDRLGEMTLEGMYQGAVAAPWGALFGGVGMVRNGKAPATQLAPEMQQFFTQQAQEANTMLSRQGLTVALDAAAQHVDNLETRRQGPEALTEMLAELLPENFKQTWLGPDDARTLYQDAQENGQEAELLDALGTDAETVQQAVETGQPLPVDTAAVLAKAQPEARAQIMQAMRVTPGGASGTEAAQFDPAKRTEEAVRRVVEGAESANPNDPDTVLAQARSAQKLHAEVNKETTRLTQQIEATGYPRHVAKANAELLAQNALAMQAAYGFPADETLRQVTYSRAEHSEQQDGAHYQLDDNGNAVSPGEPSPRIAPVVSVDPSTIVDADGKPINLKDTPALRNWIKEKYRDATVTINDDGTIQKFTEPNLRASVKRRDAKQRKMYANLDGLLESALREGDVAADARHEGKVAGQNIYYSAAKIGDNYFSVRFKVDMPLKKDGTASYKDHKVAEIEIAPALYVGLNPPAALAEANPGAIRGISLSVLKGDVKPSRIEGGTLFQSAYHGSPYRFDKFTLDHIGSGEGAQAFGWGLYFAGEKNVAEYYRKSLAQDRIEVSQDIKNRLKTALRDVDYLGFDSAGQAIAAITSHTDWAERWDVTKEEAEKIQPIIDEYNKAKEGQLYKVEVPEDNELLLWDKPLSGQSEEVRKVLASALMETAGNDLLTDVDATGKSMMADALMIQGYEAFSNEVDRLHGLYPESNTAVLFDIREKTVLSGEDIYKYISSSFGSDRAASEYLNSLGIKGITYLDGASRSDGEGSYNYVIFDDAAINILQTYYQRDGKKPLGSVTFTPQSAAVRIFPNANLSTIPHESGHIFVENLTRIAADDGSIALRSLQNRMENALLGKDFEVKKTINGLMAQALNAKPDQRGAALHTLAAELRNATKQAKENSAKYGEDIAAMKQAAKDEGKEYAGGVDSGPWLESQMFQYYADSDARTLAAAERVVKTAIKHLRGLDQAREDLHTLRQFAGIDENADITPGTENYTKLHEATARAFEQYLMEGNAPSPQLKGVFSRMRAWLLDIYKQARDALGLPITDPVRRVFDRMLATDQQIRQSRQIQNVLFFENNFIDQHATDDVAYAELADLRNAAEIEIQAVMDRATLKDRNRRYKEYYAAALDALDASPWWQMVSDLAARRRDDTGNSFGGLDRDSMARYIGAEMTAELSRMRPGLINAQGNGLPVDVAAQEYGYEGGDSLATELYDSLVGRRETKKGLAKTQADQAMQSEDAMAENDAMLIGGEGYAAYLDRVDEEVLRKAAQKGYRTVEEQERFVRNSITPRSRITNQAFHIIQHTPLREITPARYQAMLDKALRDRQAALLDGNVMQAVNAVYNSRVANELIWDSQYQLRQRDDLLQLAGETGAAKPGTFPSVHTAALRKLLNQYGLATTRGLSDPEFAPYSLRELVQQTIPQDVVDVMPSFASWLLDARDPKTGQPLLNGYQKFSDLTPSQLLEVDNLLKYLRKTGYDARTDARNSEAAKIKLQVNQAVSAMQPLKDLPVATPDTLRGKSQDAVRGMYAAVDALRWQFRKADGFENIMGEAESGGMEKLHDQILTGEQRIRTRIDDISTQMAPHLVHLWESVQAWEKKFGKNLMVKDANGQIVAPPVSLQKAYGRKTWTADMVLAMALNCGNSGNMARLTSGYELKYEMLAPLLGDQMAARIMSAGQEFTMRTQGNRQGLLSVADWQAIQGVWDALHTQWADTQAVHERMYGFKPQGVEPMQLTITDPETGQVAALRGGYYPVRYDPKVSEKVAQWGEQEDMMSRNESIFAVPSAKRGHTQARTDRAPGLPLRLDTGLIMEHVNDVVRLIELGEVVRRADRITQNPEFRREYVRAYGQADYDAIRPNLRGLVRKEPPPKSDMVVSLANTMRKYLVPWGLSWNLKVAALQLTAVFPAMGDLGARPMLESMAYMTRHGMTALRQIWDADPYMKSRMDNIDQDLQRNIANFSPSKREKSITIAGKEISWEDVVNAGMWPISAVDAVATGGVWMAAYNKKLSQLHGEKVKYGVQTDSEFHQQAVDYAGSMVKQSNPDFDPSSRSGFLRAQNAYRLVNNFASAITLFAARHKYMYTARAKGKVSLGQLARFEAYETLLPAASMLLFLALARGYFGGDDKDKKEMAKLAVSTATDQITMRIPMFGNVVGDGLLAAIGMDEGGQKGGGIRTALDEPTRQFANITGKGGRAAWHGVKNDEQAKALMYAAGDIVSFIARVPVSKLIKSGERGYNQWLRGHGTPASIIMPRPGK